MSKQINRYYTLGKLFEQPIDYDLVSDFVQQYVNIAQKKGLKPDEVIQALKNASTELNDAIMTNCVNLQKELSNEIILVDNGEWMSVKEAATIYGYEPATIRNWTKRKTDPLLHKNLGDRKTFVSRIDIKRFALSPKTKR